MPNVVISRARAVAAIPTENQATAPSMILRRPIRSPIAPALSAPIITPTNAYEPRAPAWAAPSAPICEGSFIRVGSTAP